MRETQEQIFAANRVSGFQKPFQWITSEAVTSQESLQFDRGGDHPTLTYKHLVGKGILAPLTPTGSIETKSVPRYNVRYFCTPAQIDFSDLDRVHGSEYLRELGATETAGPAKSWASSTLKCVPVENKRCSYIRLSRCEGAMFETWMCQHSARVFYRANGGLLEIATKVWTGALSSAIMLGGGGHHVGHSHCSGFHCINGMAVCARALMHRYPVGSPRPLSRVLVLDWDIHQGDGIEQLVRLALSLATLGGQARWVGIGIPLGPLIGACICAIFDIVGSKCGRMCTCVTFGCVLHTYVSMCPLCTCKIIFRASSLHHMCKHRSL